MSIAQYNGLALDDKYKISKETLYIFGTLRKSDKVCLDRSPMAFFDDLALGSPYHRAACADTYLKIEPISDTPSAAEAFALIVEAARKAAELNNFGFESMADLESGRCQWARIDFRNIDFVVRNVSPHQLRLRSAILKQ